MDQAILHDMSCKDRLQDLRKVSSSRQPELKYWHIFPKAVIFDLQVLEEVLTDQVFLSLKIVRFRNESF